MKKIKIAVRSFALALAVVTAAVFSGIVYADKSLAENYFLVEGTQLEVNCQVPITAEIKETVQTKLTRDGEKTAYNANFKLLGVFPVSSANVSLIDEMSVKVLGTPFGIKVYTDGVMVVNMDNVDSPDGDVNPAKKAGIRVGDTIRSINGKRVYSNEDVADIVSSSNGRKLSVVIVRGEEIKAVNITPVYSVGSGIYRIGIWVRDSTAGIGTLTFYSPADNIVCGLGHGICDTDTEQLMSVSSGEFVSAEILSCVKGSVGTTGELKGKLRDKLVGRLLLNSETGVYGENTLDYNGDNLVQIALKQEICDGAAYIYTTVDGNEPNLYTCEIAHRSKYESASTHNMTVTVTDERLLNSTGGIVQGMSGSPILQNGKLVGAVTHVFVNNPKKGYAIFAENMLKTAQNAAKENSKAS